MRAVVQRVKRASVTIDGAVFSSIKNGILVFLGIAIDDNEEDINYIIDKLVNLRIFSDENDKMNNSLLSISGEILVVSQFTLYGDARKGRRPSYSMALSQDLAESFYERFIEKLKLNYEPSKVKSGKFRAMMDVELINDGPVTILLDSKRVF